MQERIAQHLLAIGAVELRPSDPFTWTSGIKSPIYCDNRVTLSYPDVRKEIAQGLAKLIQEQFPEANAVSGTATAGIPHAAWVADLLNLPMSYVRGEAKSHGKQNQIEGRVAVGSKVVVIEDLISTGKSSLAAVHALQAEGVHVLGVVGIFTYGFKETEAAFAQANVPFFTLTTYPTLIDVANQQSRLTAKEMRELESWNPFEQSPQ